MLSDETQRRALSRCQSEEIKILNIAILRVGMESISATHLYPSATIGPNCVLAGRIIIKPKLYSTDIPSFFLHASLLSE